MTVNNKKNKIIKGVQEMKKLILKLSVLVMVLTLVTLPLVSGTYAKYATAASGSDTARVAKWGVNTTQEIANLFAASYDNVADGTVGLGIIAPGTAGSTIFTITGTPEVDYHLEIAVTAAYTGLWKSDAVTDYYPVLFSLDGGAPGSLET